jgi:hypothetical protein
MTGVMHILVLVPQLQLVQDGFSDASCSTCCKILSCLHSSVDIALHLAGSNFQ